MAFALEGYHFRKLELPGAAGERARAKDDAGLVRELGDNYAKYHRTLALQLRDLGPRPRPSDYANDPDAYFDRSALIQEIVMAEDVLRRCRAVRREGRAFDAGRNPSSPLVDAKRRLLSTENDRPEPDDPGHSDDWTPPRPVAPWDRN
jgi:hypothetical protein